LSILLNLTNLNYTLYIVHENVVHGAEGEYPVSRISDDSIQILKVGNLI